MQLTNEFEVPAPPERAMAFLLDVERVAPCVPGAELLNISDDRSWSGRLKVRLGPISLAFDGDVQVEEVDSGAGLVRMRAKGRELKGKGNATAIVTSRLEAAGGESTRVMITTEVNLSGPIAQYGRGILQDVSGRLVDQFAECLSAQLSERSPESPDTTAQPAPKPIGGLRLGIGAIMRAVARALRRLFRRPERPSRS